MRDFFKSRRKQNGALMLLVSLVLIGAWMRSAVMTDAVEINGAYRIYSTVGQIGFAVSTPKTVLNMIDVKHEPVPAEYRSMLALPYLSTRWLSVPYWCFTVPIAGFSLLFLLSNPEVSADNDLPRQSRLSRKKRNAKSR